MLNIILASLTWVDWLAVACFLCCWTSYTWLVERGPRAERGLVGASYPHRLNWAHAVINRENRIVDASLVGNLMHSVSFYASTTIYVIAGLLALMGTVDRVESFARDLPFARHTSPELLELKLLLLLGVFVVAYFKFTWSLRQFNFLSILIGGAPDGGIDRSEADRYANRLAQVNAFAGDEFNRGIRAYYFGLAAAAWFIQPWLFLATTAVVTTVLYRRDFSSPTLHVLRG